MKKSFKFLTILFAVILLCGIVAVSAMASGDETPSAPADGYYFQVYNPTNNTVTKYDNPESFHYVIEHAADGSVITLLWDIEEDENAEKIYVGYGATEAAPKTIYWDLNGRYYSFVRKENTSDSISFEIPAYVELNVYSSKPGGRIFNYQKENAGKAAALFWLRNKNAAINLGEITVPVEFNHTNGTYTAGKPTTYEGDNLSTYSAALVGVMQNATNDANIKVNINGGTYTHNAGAAALIESTADETGEAAPKINVQNATLISNYKDIVNIHINEGNAPTANVSFKNCLIYSTAANAIGGYAESANLSFDGCSFVGLVGDISDKITLTNCKFANGASYSTSKELVRTSETKTLPLYTYNFAYDSNGAVKPSSYNYTQTDVYIEYNYVTAEGSEYAKITWDANDVLGRTIEENWVKGKTPTPPTSLVVKQTDVYKYVFDKTSAVTGDATYTLRGYAAFAIKANLNLSDKFTFNIYIPKDICDNNINYLYLAGNKVNKGEISEIENIEGVDYYCVSHPVFANKASESFTFSIDITGYNGKSLTQEYTFSVLNYIEKVLAGEYGNEAIALAEATKTYISALDSYVKGTVVENISYTPSKEGDMTPVKDTIKTATLIFKESIAFRFYSNSTPEITLTLPTSNESGEITTENKTGEWTTVTDSAELAECGGYYCEVILPVKFLNQGITITVGENSGTFYLDDYIRYAQNDLKDNQNFVNLVNSIGNYCKAALEFADVNSGDQSPNVDFMVNGEYVDKIVYDNDTLTAAEELKAYIEAKTKTTLALVSKESAGDVINNAVILSLINPKADYDSRISVDGDNLLINVGLKSFIADSADLFTNDFIKYAETDIIFDSGFRKDYFTDRLYYSDFGAAGDGATDDFFNLKAAHDHANATKRHTVYADSGKTYRIHETRIGGTGAVQTISIKTNVIWGDARFTIDDSDLSVFDNTYRHDSNIFNVVSDYDDITVTDAAKLASLAGVGEVTEKLDLGLGYPAMITIYNANHKVYRRYGYDSAQDQHEVILIDKDGNIDESTPFMFDYTEVTKYIIHRTDVEPVTVKGGVFTTIASNASIYNTETGKYKDDYFARGINVSRPYTVLDGVEHYVTGEISLNEQSGTNCGVAYTGFFYATSTNDVLFKNCVLTGRRCYAKSEGGTTGTYDFGAKGVNKIRLEGCIQSNFYLKINEDGTTSPAFTLTYDDNGVPRVTPDSDAILSMGNNPAGGRICWGIGGTNFCKNMEYINSVLSRFDAHCGLLNGKVVGTTINFFAMVGKGDFIIENCTWIAPDAGEANNSMIYLRDDYGSPWEGTITIKDTVAVNHVDSSGNPSEFGVVFHKYLNWDFGYVCYFPNLIIDNLTFKNFADGAKVDLIYPDCAVIDKDIHLETIGGNVNKNPVVPPEFITINTNGKGYKYYIPNNNFFKETNIVVDDKILNGVVYEFDSPFISFD